MIYTSKPTECQAMHWHNQLIGGAPSVAMEARAQEIVAWVNSNSGKAEYTANYWAPNPLDPPQPAIAVRTVNGWAYAALGEYVVMGDTMFAVARCKHGHGLPHVFFTDHRLEDGGECPGPVADTLDFHPLSAEMFEARWV